MEKLPVAKNLPVMVRTVRKEPWVEDNEEEKEEEEEEEEEVEEGPKEVSPPPRSQI